jgi:hypothetical protein
MRQGRMNFRKTFSRGLILPVVFAAAMPGAAATAAPKTYTYDGTVANVCKIGTSTSYSVSIVVVNIGSGQMATTISLDGSVGTQQNQNNKDAVVSKDYTTICNRTTPQNLTLTAPAATKTGGGTLAYTITIFNASSGGGSPVGSGSSVPIPAQTSAQWSIVVTATNKNSLVAGTYTATVTIQ